MTSKEYFRLRTLENLLRRAPEHAYSKSEIREQLNAALEHEGYNGIGSKTLSNLFKELTEMGAVIMHQRVKDSGYSDKALKYVRYYENIHFSALDEIITDQQESVIREVLNELSSISGNPMIDELGIVLGQRLEEKNNENDNTLLVHFDSQENYLGRKHIKSFFDAVKGKYAVKFDYQPFGKDLEHITLSPYLLKQFNHRWYCVGYWHGSPYELSNLALDRVVSEPERYEGFQETQMTRADWNDRFQEIVGVTHFEDKKPVNVTLRFYGNSRYYILTKPFSIAQRPLSPEDLKNDPMEVMLEQIIPNYELKQRIMYYGDEVEVVAPKELRNEIAEAYCKASERYNS